MRSFAPTGKTLQKWQMRTRLAIELNETTAARLEAAAAQEQKTPETFAIDAVTRAIDDLEAWAEDEAA